MNKFWRIGLILLVALVACSDKKAEQATALKAEIEAQLAKAAGPDKKYLSYGDVTVTPGDGDAYNVTIDKVMFMAPEIEPIDFGKVAFKLTPDGDDIRKYSDLTIPATYKIKNKSGDEFDVNINLDHSTGSWSKKPRPGAERRHGAEVGRRHRAQHRRHVPRLSTLPMSSPRRTRATASSTRRR